MSAPAVCDTVPAPLREGEQTGGTFPSGVRPSADSGTVIGTVLELGTRRPVAGAIVTLHQPATATPVMASDVAGTPTNVAGNFVVRVRTPGPYALAVHRIGYRPRYMSITVRTGSIDPLRIELQYEHCIGF